MRIDKAFSMDGQLYDIGARLFLLREFFGCAPFVVTDGLFVVFGHGDGGLGLQVVHHHHGAALALHYAAFGVDGALQQGEALGSQFDGGGFDVHVVHEEYGVHEVGADVGHYNADFVPFHAS